MLFQNPDDIETLPSAKLKKSKQDKDSRLDGDVDENIDNDDDHKVEVPGERVTTDTVERGPESTIHTALENLHLDNKVGWARVD